MEAHYRAFQGRLVIKVEGSTIKELFEQIGPIAEVLDGDDCCGKCASPHIYPRAREAKGFTYYELVCSDCSAKLSFGQHKDGGSLWAKRVDDQGNRMDHRGWAVYHAIAAPAEAKPQASTPPRNGSAPRAGGTPPQDPRLENYFKRCTDIRSSGEVFGEICDAIGALSNDDAVNEAWNHALKTHGDPNNKPQALRPVLTSLLNVLYGLEAKVKP